MSSVDLWDTFIQYLKNRKSIDLSKYLLADQFVGSVNEITPEFLKEKGIEAIIWDVDGTLMGYHGLEVDHTIKEAYGALSGFEQVILSNSGERRFLELGGIFPEIPVLRLYEKKSDPNIVAERKLLGGQGFFVVDYGEGRGSLNENGNIGAYVNGQNIINGYRALKKPNPKLIEYAMKVMGIDDPAKVAMIGDKAMTDIVGGNMAGVYTIQIYPPLRAGMDTKLIRWFQRPFEERKILKYLDKANRTDDIARILEYKIQQNGGLV